MEKSRRSAGHHRMYWIVGVIALAATLGFRPGAARASCVGDCDGGGSVTVNEIIILVNMALGQGGTCPNGVPEGAQVNVALIIQAVNNDLNSTCVQVTPTPTQTPGTVACGDGVKTAPEECDDGGTCIGGNQAGKACTSEDACGVGEDGVCISGENSERVCSTDNDCPHSKCQRCVPFGGDGCAANCTTEESPVTFTFSSNSISNVNTELFGTIPLPLSGHNEVISGKVDANGILTYIVKAASVVVPEIDVGGLACACVRAVPPKSCGGTVFEKDGSQATDCTPGYNPDADTACNGKKPCTFMLGPGNSSAGYVGCGTAGLDGVNFSWKQNSRGSLDPADCAAQPGLGAPTCADFPVIKLSGHGSKGSGVTWNTQAIGTATGSCDANPGYCTDADPFSVRGTPQNAAQVTNTATAEIDNINGEDGTNLGPYTVTGTPFNCDQPENISGETIVSTFTAPNQLTTEDIAVTTILQAQ
jgi:hypothetical protein